MVLGLTVRNVYRRVQKILATHSLQGDGSLSGVRTTSLSQAWPASAEPAALLDPALLLALPPPRAQHPDTIPPRPLIGLSRGDNSPLLTCAVPHLPGGKWELVSSRQSIDTLSVTHCPPKWRGLSRHRSFSGGGRSRGSEAFLPPGTPFPWQPEARRCQSRDRGKGLYHPETRRGGPGAAEDPTVGTRRPRASLLSPPSYRRRVESVE